MKIKKYLKSGKPAIKGCILVFIGIFNSRVGIGIEIFINNLIFGPLAYLFLAFSGLILAKMLQNVNNPSDKCKLSNKGVLIVFGILIIISLILIISNLVENVPIYYLNIPIILFTTFISIFWILLSFFGQKKIVDYIFVNMLIFTLSFSFGLIYGVFLNTYIIPMQIYFFFFSISSLQLSRELTKGFNENERNEEFALFVNRNNDRKILKFSLSFQYVALIFLIIPLFFEMINTFLLLFLMIFSLIVIGLASFLTLASLLEREIYKRISLILKIGILLELFMFLIIGI